MNIEELKEEFKKIVKELMIIEERVLKFAGDVFEGAVTRICYLSMPVFIRERAIESLKALFVNVLCAHILDTVYMAKVLEKPITEEFYNDLVETFTEVYSETEWKKRFKDIKMSLDIEIREAVRVIEKV